MALDRRDGSRSGGASSMSRPTQKAAGSGSPCFLLWSSNKSVPLLAAVLLLVAFGSSGVAAFSAPQPVVARVSSATSTDFRGDTRLFAAFDRWPEGVESVETDADDADAGTEQIQTPSSSLLLSPSSVITNDDDTNIASAARSFTVASALFLSVLLGNGAHHPTQAAWAADAPAKPAAAKPAATTSTSTSTTSSPVEASLHIPKLRRQIKSLQKTLLEKEAIMRQDQRPVIQKLEKKKRIQIELQRAQDEEKRVKLELERNELKKKAAAEKAKSSSTSTSSTTSSANKAKPASLSKTQVRSLQKRGEVATKRITNAKSALTKAETDLKSYQTSLDKSTKEVQKVKKELKDVRQKLKEAKRVRGAEGRYVFDSVAPLTFGGGLVWWLVNNQDYGREGNYGREGYDRDGYYDEYGYNGGKGGRGSWMDRRRSQRRQFQTAIAVLVAIGLTSSISSFNAEGDGLTSTVVTIMLGVGVLSWVVVWQQRQREEYSNYGGGGGGGRRDRYDEYGNRIVASEDFIDTSATQAAIILFSALGLTAALLSYGSYGNDVSDVLNGSTFLVLGAVAVGLWAYNNEDYVDQYNNPEYGEGVYGGRGRRFDLGVPFDFDAVFSRNDGDNGRAKWWEWWKTNDPDGYSNGLNRRGRYEDDRVDVIRNDDYYANYELDRRFSSGPPRATNGYYGRDVEPRSGGRAGPLARRGEYARREIDDGRYYNDDDRYYDDNNRYDGRGQYQDRRFREYSDQPPTGGARPPPPGAAPRPSAGGEGSQDRDSNRWGNSLSQWD